MKTFIRLLGVALFLFSFFTMYEILPDDWLFNVDTATIYPHWWSVPALLGFLICWLVALGLLIDGER